MGLKFVDLFCGIGTIRMGMEKAGHECVYSVEWDKHKRRIYSIIFGGEPEGEDIRKVRANDIPRSDVWCFGFPCQDISVAGKQLGLQGGRSGLFYEVCRLLQDTPEEDRPRYLLIENVKNLLSINNGWDFFNLLYTLDEIGYDTEWQLLNSKDFGVPQNRERVFIVGHLRGRSTGKVFPIGGTNPKTIIRHQGDVSGKGYASEQDRVYFPEGIMACIPAARTDSKINIAIQKTHGATTTIHYEETGTLQVARLDKVPCVARACLTPDRLEKRQNGRRFKEPDEPMLTLTKQDIHGVAINCINPRKPDGTQTYQHDRVYDVNGHLPALNASEIMGRNNIYDGISIRKLTPKECWRLQGIADEITDKVIQAGINDTQMYRGAGDACTVDVIEQIAKKLT